MWTTLRGQSRARLLDELVAFATLSADRRFAASSSAAIRPSGSSAGTRRRRLPAALKTQSRPGEAEARLINLERRDNGESSSVGAAVPYSASEATGGSDSLDDFQETDLDGAPRMFAGSRRWGDSRPLIRPPLAAVEARRRGEYGTMAQGYVGAGPLNRLHHLSVALAIGQTSRARAIFHDLEDALGYHRIHDWSASYNRVDARVTRSENSEAPDLREVVPASVHAGFVRRYYADALKAQEEDRHQDRRRAEMDAFEWLQNLRYNGRDWGEIDHHVVAAAIKGVLQ